ncbi:MAG: chromosome segregation protein SMC [Myxococcota bacterium]
MRIRSVEITGFKSFAERTVLAFEGGISAIVGPNGCGKSNIVDAIRWVMGEQNPRYLRGRLMEDVVFAGTDSKPPVGMAEVVMTLDNSDGLAPGIYKDFAEIQVARRLYRSGESEYLLNRVPCRLRDITDFFMDTGVGTRGYTVVEQGRVAEIVSTKPEERRFIFEEAAGIGKYRQRRRESESKLRATEQNLLRVTDILGELRRQIASLDRQAHRANQYKKLKARERDLELVVAREECGEHTARLASAESELESLRSDAVELDARVARAEARLEESRISHLERERALQKTSEDLFELRSSIQSVESRIEYRRRERKSLLALAEERETEVEQLRERLGSNTSSLNQMIGDFAGTDQALADDAAELESRETRLREHGERLSALYGRREALQNRLVELAAEEATLGSQARALEDRSRELERRVRESEAVLEASSQHAERLRREELTLERDLRGTLAERDSLGWQLGQQLRAVEQGETDLAVARSELETVRAGAEKASARLATLNEIERRESQRVSDAIEQFPETQRRRIRGALSGLIRVEDGLETALEAALEGVLDAIVVDDAGAALDLLGWLRKEQSARATLLPASPATSGERAAAVAVGRPLLDLVSVERPYRPLVERLLGDVLLVEDLGEVLSRFGTETPRAVFVTREGETLDRRGALTGGLRAPPGALSRAGEIGRLGEALAELETRREALETGTGRAVNRVAEAQSELENARSRAHTAELAVVNFEKDLERMRERTKEALESLEEHRAAKSVLISQLDRVNEEQEANARGLGGIERQHGEVQSQADELREQIAEQSREQERLEQRLVQARIELAELGARHDQFREARDRLQAAVDEGRQWIARRGEEVRAARDRGGSLASSTSADERELATLIREEEERRTAQESLRVAYQSRSAEIESAEADLRATGRERETLRERQASAGLALREARMHCDQVTTRIRERFDVDITRYAPPAEHLEGAPEERERELERLRQGLRTLGEVHLGAIEEYEEVSERNRFLTEQRADLETSIERLRNAIARINRTSRARFRATFEAVDAQFQQIFPRIFNGGRAHLSLTDSADVLEAGIEITAQPPGKRLQNVNLLSGGEKALTALSLLMAVFAVKPSPFFLLDEVDAALDDANVGRFNELLLERAESSQFLLVTHNKGTIEIAHTLFGVTMQERGLSKLVTVDLLP